MRISRSHGYLQGVGRLRLHYRSWEVVPARAAFLLIHGLSDHSGRYADFAEVMGGFGMSTFALDLRGHGHSDGRRGHVTRFDAFLQDVERFRREVYGIVRPDLPLFLLGHSMGGLIALRYLEEYDSPLAGGILVSPWLGTAVRAARWKVTMARVVDPILPALPMFANIPAEYLSHDAAVVEAFRHDPLVHDRVTPRLFNEVSDAMGLALRRAERVTVPLLFLIAGDDRLVEAGRSRTLASTFRDRAPEVATRSYAGQYHELLNERDRALVMNDIREWVGKHTALPAGVEP